MKINILFTLLLIRFYQVENIIPITYLTVSRMPQVESRYHYQFVKLDVMLDNVQKILAASNIGQNGHFFFFFSFFFFFFEKKGTKNLTTPYSIPFLSVLHQNKALHNFHKRGQRPTVGRIKGLDQGLMGHSNMVGAKTGVAACINEIESI